MVRNQLEKSLDGRGKAVYNANELSEILQISNREAYYILNSTEDYKVVRFGRNIWADKVSFDAWFHGEGKSGSMHTYTPAQIAELLQISVQTVRNNSKEKADFRVLKFGVRIIRIPKDSFDKWLGLAPS